MPYDSETSQAVAIVTAALAANATASPTARGAEPVTTDAVPGRGLLAVLRQAQTAPGLAALSGAAETRGVGFRDAHAPDIAAWRALSVLLHAGAQFTKAAVLGPDSVCAP
ncbi:hypothetical protein [Streptomyces rubrogriseus]|uniref:hypothetical protein n=1 Tax=Streptomyces rubrogriseus TaxID=194673 RepID=UPI0036569642